jgi:hypothetical protein
MIFTVIGIFVGWMLTDIVRLRRDVRGLALSVADLDRDVTAVEASTHGDGK